MGLLFSRDSTHAFWVTPLNDKCPLWILTTNQLAGPLRPACPQTKPDEAARRFATTVWDDGDPSTPDFACDNDFTEAGGVTHYSRHSSKEWQLPFRGSAKLQASNLPRYTMSRCAPLQHEIPPMKDLTTDNITENVIITNNQCDDPRTRFIFEHLVRHLHDFARETRLTSQEWMTAVEFLTKVGQISDDLRAEMILLSDTLGLSLLVDSIDHPRVGKATEGTVLGPFHTHDAPVTENGYVLHEDPTAERLFVLCTLKDTKGRPIVDAQCDVWEGDAHGFYDVQNPNREHPDGRAVIRSNEQGIFYFMAVVPVPYPIPDDGPVGDMLKMLNRHPNRPGHIHFMVDAPGYDKLVTALYPRGDPYETSDPVFGVKESLIVDLGTVDSQIATAYNVPEGTRLLSYDFVLASEAEATKLKLERGDEETKKAESSEKRCSNGV